jgi:hypothetical protein
MEPDWSVTLDQLKIPGRKENKNQAYKFLCKYSSSKFNTNLSIRLGGKLFLGADHEAATPLFSKFCANTYFS